MLLAGLGEFDEAEQWLAIGAAANISFAVETLERIRKDRAAGRLGGTRQGSGSDVLQSFEVDSVMFYDGVGHVSIQGFSVYGNVRREGAGR